VHHITCVVVLAKVSVNRNKHRTYLHQSGSSNGGCGGGGGGGGGSSSS